MKISILSIIFVLMCNCEGYRNLTVSKRNFDHEVISKVAYFFKEIGDEVSDIKDVQITDNDQEIQDVVLEGLNDDYVSVILRKYPINTLSVQKCGEIDPAKYHKWNNVKEIIIIENIYSTIKNYTFEGAGNLKKIKLRGNQIKVIQLFAFVSLDSLVEIDLSDNKIENIMPGAFSLPTLRLLNLKKS